MKRIVFSLLAFVMTMPIFSQNVNKVFMPEKRVESRQEIVIPDVDGYMVLKCDFHSHTVFSDGNVWPTFRVSEAWKDGLDALAITDHIEYRPHAQYINADFNTSYEIAKPSADNYGLILIKGTEITRKQGEIGHFNALFIDDANTIPNDDPFVAIENARKQGAFILFNHPGWAIDTCIITEFQQKLMDKKMIDGIEVFNHFEFYPRAVSWCVDLKYPMFANSDEHGVISEDYRSFGADAQFVRHRPLTLVLAKEKSEKGIKDALFAGRTIACSDNTFAGTEDMLVKLFNSCVEVKKLNEGKKNVIYTFSNSSSFPFAFTVNGGDKKELPPMSTIRVSVPLGNDMSIEILNMWCYENKHPKTRLAADR